MNNDTVVIELDKTRTLKFRRKELKMMEGIFKKKISKIEFEELGIDDISKITHLALSHEDPDLTLAQAEELIDEYPFFGLLVQKVMTAFTIAMNGPVAPEPQNGDTTEEKN